EVEDEHAVACAEVGALHGVEEVPAGGVGGDGVGRVAEGKEEAAGIALEPVAVELVQPAVELELRGGEARESVARPAARADLALDRLRPRERRVHTERRVVVE